MKIQFIVAKSKGWPNDICQNVRLVEYKINTGIYFFFIKSTFFAVNRIWTLVKPVVILQTFSCVTVRNYRERSKTPAIICNFKAATQASIIILQTTAITPRINIFLISFNFAVD